MALLARLSLLLVILLVVLSAYLRLDHSGIGCEPWPACYGNIGVPGDSPSVSGTYERLLEEASKPLSWATPLHRLVASVLGLLVLGMTLLSLHQREHRLISFSLLALTVFLAWLGIYSEGLHSPAVVMGNLGGGFAMLGLLGWMVVGRSKAKDLPTTGLRSAAIGALCLLVLQIAIGGLTSANFAASACQTLPDCHGSWLPGGDIVTAMDLTRVHEIGSTGMVLGGAERADIHKLHRVTALLAALVISFAGAKAIQSGRDFRIIGTTLIALVTLEFALGVSAVISSVPIGVAVAHNWVAALLLLVTLKLLAESQAASG